MSKQGFRPVDAHVLAALLGQVQVMLSPGGVYAISLVGYDRPATVMMDGQAFRQAFGQWVIEPRTGSPDYPHAAFVELGGVRFEHLIHRSKVDAWLPAVPATA